MCIYVFDKTPTFREWRKGFTTTFLHGFNILRDNEMTFTISSPEERNATICVLQNIHNTSVLQYVRRKRKKNQTNRSKEDILGGAVKEHKRKSPLKVSNNLVGRVWTTVSEGSVGFDHNGDLGCCFCQSILLFKERNVLYMSLEDAEHIIIHSKQSTTKRAF